MKKEIKIKNQEQGVAVVALLVLILLIGGLVVSLNLINIQQIFKSRASLANASLSLPASETVSPNQEFEVPLMLATGGDEIVAADLVLNFDKSVLQLLDIIEKPSASNRLTTLTPRNGSFDKNKVITIANSTGTIDFGAICFTATGCPEGQKQDLGEANPLVGLKFKALKAGTTQVSILYSPTLTTNSNLVNRNRQNVLGKVTPMGLNIIQEGQSGADKPSAPVTTLTLSKTSGFVRGDEIRLSFQATTGATSIHTNVWEGVTDPNQKTGGGNYQGFPGSGGSRIARVPFYVEYLATGSSGKEQTKNLLVVEGSFIDKDGRDIGTPDGIQQPTSPETLINRIVEPQLTNPSFEEWSNGAGGGTTDRKTPDGWIMVPANDGYSRREGGARNGSYSWMRVAYGNGGDYVGGYQDVTVSPNTTYTISGWVLAPGALSWYRSDAGGKIDVRNRLCAKTTSNQDIRCVDSTEGSGNLQKLETSFNSGSNNTIRVYFGTNINQFSFWDDFSITLQ